MTALIRITPPDEEPLALEETKAHLRVETGEDDELITNLITAARLLCEEYTRRALITQTWRLWLDAFPGLEEPWWDGTREGVDRGMIRRFVHLPRPPLVSVQAVKTYNDDNTETVFDPLLYFVDAASEPGRLALRSNANWPVPQREYNGVRIDFIAGYGDVEDVPQALKAGMLAHIAFLYENRGDEQGLAAQARGSSAPEVALMLYRPYRVHSLV
ncbi:MAG: phage head-tail connector protein [Proteobacteria bacterium]|nr:phage head-tail connector protein [Pseudomonadota bacterium]